MPHLHGSSTPPGTRPHHFCGQPVPISDHSFKEELPPLPAGLPPLCTVSADTAPLWDPCAQGTVDHLITGAAQSWHTGAHCGGQKQPHFHTCSSMGVSAPKALHGLGCSPSHTNREGADATTQPQQPVSFSTARKAVPGLVHRPQKEASTSTFSICRTESATQTLCQGPHLHCRVPRGPVWQTHPQCPQGPSSGAAPCKPGAH